MNRKWENAIKEYSVGQQFVLRVKDDAKRDRITRIAPVILLVIMTLIGAVSQKDFFSPDNLVNILYQMSIPLVISVGLMLVLLIGSIDLSIEGNMGFAGSLVAFLVTNGTNSNNFGIWGVLFCIFIGALVGFITGFLHVKARIASFIVTYAIGSIMTGAAVLIYKGTAIKVLDPAFEVISRNKFLGIPYLTIIAFAVFLIGALILNYTAFGRAVYAIGDNELAAASTGIDVGKVKILVFTISGCIASIAGILMCIRLKLGQSSIGADQMFPVVTSIVIGGGSLAGGKGGALASFIGVLIYTELVNWLTLMGVNVYLRGVIQGIIIIIAVALTINKNRRTIAK